MPLRPSSQAALSSPELFSCSFAFDSGGTLSCNDTKPYVFLDITTEYEKGSYNFISFTITDKALDNLPLSVRSQLDTGKYSKGDIFAATVHYNGTPNDTSDDYITDLLWHDHYNLDD